MILVEVECRGSVGRMVIYKLSGKKYIVRIGGILLPRKCPVTVNLYYTHISQTRKVGPYQLSAPMETKRTMYVRSNFEIKQTPQQKERLQHCLFRISKDKNENIPQVSG